MTMKAIREKQVKAEVRELENRMASSEGTARFILHVYLGRMVEAERLRKLCVDYFCRRSGRCKPEWAEEIRELVRPMKPFPTFKGKLPAAVRKFLGK